MLLGDLFDDGPLGAETVLRVMRLILDDPSAVTLIVGNHDEALELAADGGGFRASVSPSEFSEWLNAPVQHTNPLAKKLGELTVDFVSRSPRALFFRDGLLAAHGGVPLPDVWDSLATAHDLNEPTCLQDFVWTRPHHRRKRTIPNRSKRGAGVIVRSPVDRSHAYRVKFSDRFEAPIHHDQLTCLSKFKSDQIRESDSPLRSQDTPSSFLPHAYQNSQQFSKVTFIGPKSI